MFLTNLFIVYLRKKTNISSLNLLRKISSCFCKKNIDGVITLISKRKNISRNDFLLTAYRQCQVDDFHCGSKTSDPCIPKEKKCDGYLDCRSGKDEEGCTGVACLPDQYRCANGLKCIPASMKCDHKDDCGDKSDELGCSKSCFH